MALLRNESELVDYDTVILSYIKDHFLIRSDVTIHNKRIDINGDITVKQSTQTLELPGGYYFGRCNNFILALNKQVKNLKGMPLYVDNEVCIRYDDIESLDGISQHIKSVVNITHCDKLNNIKALKHAECNVLQLIECDAISTLEGVPCNIDRLYVTDCRSLSSMDIQYATVKNMYIDSCKQLKTLSTGPARANNIILINTPIKTVKDIKTDIIGDLYINRGCTELYCRELMHNVTIGDSNKHIKMHSVR